jgi:hypothetical protein
MFLIIYNQLLILFILVTTNLDIHLRHLAVTQKDPTDVLILTFHGNSLLMLITLLHSFTPYVQTGEISLKLWRIFMWNRCTSPYLLVILEFVRGSRVILVL